MQKHFIGACALAVALSLAAAAPDARAQASQDAATVKAGTYKVDPYHSQVEFSVSHFGFTEYSGFFSGASGSLMLDPAEPARSKLEVSIPVDSVMTTVTKLNDELKGEKWFDAAKFPTATFTSSRITITGKGRATITGELMLHGVTKPMTLQARFIGAGVNPLDKAYTVGFEATGMIKRGDFDVKTYLPMVGDDVRLTIAGAFERQQ